MIPNGNAWVALPSSLLISFGQKPFINDVIGVCVYILFEREMNRSRTPDDFAR